MSEESDRRNRVRSLLVFRVPVGLGLLLCAADPARLAGRSDGFDQPLWPLLFGAGAVASALPAGSAGFLAPATHRAARLGKAVFGLHVGAVLFAVAWVVPSIVVSVFGSPGP